MMEITYETQRLYFRPWTLDDTEACHELAKDEHIGPPCGWLSHKDMDETREVLKNVLINHHTFCIVEKESGAIIGNMGIDEVKTDEKDGVIIGSDERELGFWLGYPYWNKGYMTEAVNGTIDYCFNTLELSKLWCGYFDDNPASGRVQEKCGFKFEYVRRVFWENLQKDVNIITNSLTKAEWLKARR